MLPLQCKLWGAIRDHVQRRTAAEQALLWAKTRARVSGTPHHHEPARGHWMGHCWDHMAPGVADEPQASLDPLG